ncbi:hypothetical protein [Limnohabitans sp. Rim8]|uniref:hypothetical protein n=1 Tax=Limnohabitans sp. Rim8 TaxID=1100718 RepID=UPI0026035D19|nr:hypothetical protein [Limnohabitans sp. Rim8]
MSTDGISGLSLPRRCTVEGSAMAARMAVLIWARTDAGVPSALLEDGPDGVVLSLSSGEGKN